MIQRKEYWLCYFSVNKRCHCQMQKALSFLKIVLKLFRSYHYDIIMIIFSFFLSTKGNHWRHSVKLLNLKKTQILIYQAPFLIGIFIEMLPSSCKCPHVSHIISCEAVLDPKEDVGESLNQNERRTWRIESVWIVKTEHSTEWNKRGSFEAVGIRGKITPKEDISCPHPCFGGVKLHAVEKCPVQHGSQYSWSHWGQTPVASSGSRTGFMCCNQAKR